MDGARFDSLTRSLTVTGSRRRALAAALGGPFGLLGLAATAKKKGKGKGKKKGDKKKKDCKGFRPISCGDECCSLAETCKKGKKGKKDRCVGHCDDGEQNFDETDVDCGGSCRDIKKCGLFALCKEDADCDTNVCVDRPDLRTDGKLCVFCRVDAECPRFGPGNRFCFNNGCGECATNADCPADKVCNTQTHSCVFPSCANDNTDCPPARPFCIAPVTGQCPNDVPCVCGQCRTSTDCPPGQICDETGSCTGNTCPSGRDEDCPADTLCVGFQCVDCLPAGAACGGTGDSEIPCLCCFRAASCCNEGGTAAGCTCCAPEDGGSCSGGTATCG